MSEEIQAAQKESDTVLPNQVVAPLPQFTRRSIWPFVVSIVIVALLRILLLSIFHPNTWAYDFFFNRSFVQWVLLTMFTIGFVHLAWRLPVWWREQKALTDLCSNKEGSRIPSVVRARWLRLSTRFKMRKATELREYAKHLAEHDETALDAAYRIPADIVQILPLIGFFGTVYGLSMGLYRNFLVEGAATPKVFAKAIAIAFDNTLLGLALTILLFVFQSLLRKREEGVLLDLNSLIAQEIADRELNEAPSMAGPDQQNQLVTRLDKFIALLEQQPLDFARLLQEQAQAVLGAVVKDGTERQTEFNEALVQRTIQAVEDQSVKLLKAVVDSTATFPSEASPVYKTLTQIKDDMSKLVTMTSHTIATEEATRAHDNEMQATISAIYETANGLAEKLDHVATAESVAEIGALSTALQALLLGLRNGDEQQLRNLAAYHTQLDNIARIVTEVQSGLNQQTSQVVADVGELLVVRVRELREETKKLLDSPRTFTLVEALKRDGDADVVTNGR